MFGYLIALIFIGPKTHTVMPKLLSGLLPAVFPYFHGCSRSPAAGLEQTPHSPATASILSLRPALTGIATPPVAAVPGMAMPILIFWRRRNTARFQTTS